MRTLICEGIRAFIVVEGLTSLPWFRNLFLIGNLLRYPKRDEQGISL